MAAVEAVKVTVAAVAATGQVVVRLMASRPFAHSRRSRSQVRSSCTRSQAHHLQQGTRAGMRDVVKCARQHHWHGPSRHRCAPSQSESPEYWQAFEHVLYGTGGGDGAARDGGGDGGEGEPALMVKRSPQSVQSVPKWQ